MSSVILSIVTCAFAHFAGRSLHFLSPTALALGCAFAVLNLLFYRHVVALILGQRSSLLAVLMLFLKLPLLLILLLVLSQQDMRFIANAVAGSLVFIPATLLASIFGEPIPGEVSEAGKEQ